LVESKVKKSSLADVPVKVCVVPRGVVIVVIAVPFFVYKLIYKIIIDNQKCILNILSNTYGFPEIKSYANYSQL